MILIDNSRRSQGLQIREALKGLINPKIQYGSL